MLKKSGRMEAIQAAQQRGIALAAQDLSQIPGGNVQLERLRGVLGGPAGSAPSGNREDLDDGIGYQEPGKELSHETMTQGIGYSDRGESFSLFLFSALCRRFLTPERFAAPPQENFPESLSGSAPSGATLPGSSSSSSGPSRWDELRRSRASPPSSWDVLREANNKSQESQGSNASDSAEDASSRESRLDKERRKREFDAMFDREAKGGDDGLGDKDKVWR